MRFLSSTERPCPTSYHCGHSDNHRNGCRATDEAPHQALLLGLHDAARTPPGLARISMYKPASALIANAHQTCQCDRNPPAIKKLLVQPASTPNRHAARAPAPAATGVNKSPNSAGPSGPSGPER